MPPKHNPSIHCIKPKSKATRAQCPPPPPPQKVTEEEIAQLRELMKTELLNGNEPRVFQVDLTVSQEERYVAPCQAATGLGKTVVAAGPYVLGKNSGKVTLMVSPLIGLQEEMVLVLPQSKMCSDLTSS